MISLRKLVPLLSISIVWCAIGWVAHDLASRYFATTNLSAEQKLVAQAQAVLQERFLILPNKPDQPLAERLAEAAIMGMLNVSDDRYSDLYGPVATARVLSGLEGNIGITGLNFDIIDGQRIVRAVQPNGPAARAGVAIGDILLGTDEADFTPYTGGYETGIMLQGSPDTTYFLTVLRSGKRLRFPITRDRWDYLSYRVIDDQIGYLKSAIFYLDETDKAVAKIFEEFGAKEIKALIWDLRGSGGGAVKPVQNILAALQPKGSLLFIAQFADGAEQPFYTESDGRFRTLPMAILIDHGTFSASEIAAAALLDRPHTELIGSTTAGKGTIQDQILIDPSHMLHFTIAKWLTPTGRWIEQHGVEPTIIAEDDPDTADDETMVAALAYLTPFTVQ